MRHRRGLVTAGWLIMVVGLVLAGAGCSLKNPHALGTIERARFWGEHERWQDAADSYEIFVRQNPTDSLAARAQYEKALAYMELGEYPLAAVEFQILAQDYPTSDLVEDAVFREGECYYLQVGRIERDVTPAHEARLHWLDFSRQYPTSGYMDEVRAYMQEIADLMVRKQLRAVEVYEQLRRHDAAALVLDRVLVDEPTSSLIDEVLMRRAKLAERLEDEETARQMYRRLVAEHPDSDLREAAQDALARLAPADATS
ncbi:outer membrane protein assembly factor BamD [bacterium]|nr:outer membrane protein assembly factor BamD [bacterium]